jgi:hypothetical protein
MARIFQWEIGRRKVDSLREKAPVFLLACFLAGNKKKKEKRATECIEKGRRRITVRDVQKEKIPTRCALLVILP